MSAGASAPGMPWNGCAFARDEQNPLWRQLLERAGQLGQQLGIKLDEVRGLLVELRQCGWDGGGQPAFVDCQRQQPRKRARADGTVKMETVSMNYGQEYDARVTGAGPRASAELFRVVRPLEQSLSEQGPGWERMSVILPRQFHPKEDRALTQFLEQLREILSPEELAFLKVPSGFIKRGLRDSQPFAARMTYKPEDKRGFKNRGVRLAEHDVLAYAGHVAAPRHNGFEQRPMHDFGHADTSAEKRAREEIAAGLEWARGGATEGESEGRSARRSSGRISRRRPSLDAFEAAASATQAAEAAAVVEFCCLERGGAWQCPDKHQFRPAVSEENAPCGLVMAPRSEYTRVPDANLVAALLDNTRKLLVRVCPGVERARLEEEIGAFRERLGAVWAHRIIRKDHSRNLMRKWIREHKAEEVNLLAGFPVFPSEDMVMKQVTEIRKMVAKVMGGVDTLTGPTGEAAVWRISRILPYIFQHDDLSKVVEGNFPIIDNAILVTVPSDDMKSMRWDQWDEHLGKLDHMSPTKIGVHMIQYGMCELPNFPVSASTLGDGTRRVFTREICDESQSPESAFVLHCASVADKEAIKSFAMQRGWSTLPIYTMDGRVIPDAGARKGRTAGKGGQTTELFTLDAFKFLESSLLPSYFPTLHYTGADSLALYSHYSKLIREDACDLELNGVQHDGRFFEVQIDGVADGACRRELEGRVNVQSLWKESRCDVTTALLSTPGAAQCKFRQLQDVYTSQPTPVCHLQQITLGALVHLRNGFAQLATSLWRAYIIQDILPYFSKDGDASITAIADSQQLYHASTDCGNLVYSTAERLAAVKRWLDQSHQYVAGAGKIKQKVQDDLPTCETLRAQRKLLKTVHKKVLALHQKFELTPNIEDVLVDTVDLVVDAQGIVAEQRELAPVGQNQSGAHLYGVTDLTGAKLFDDAIKRIPRANDLLEGAEKVRIAATQLEADIRAYRRTADHAHGPLSAALMKRLRALCRSIKAEPSDLALYKLCGGGGLRDTLHKLSNGMTGKMMFHRPMLLGILHAFIIRGGNTLFNYLGTLALALQVGTTFIEDLKDKAGIWAHFFDRYGKTRFGLIKARGHDTLRVLQDIEPLIACFPEPYRTLMRILINMWCGVWYLVSNPYLADTFFQLTDGDLAQGTAAERFEYAGKLVAEMCAEIKDLILGVLGPLTPTLHAVVDDVPRMWHLVKLSRGNESPIEAYQIPSRVLLDGLQTSKQPNTDQMIHYMAYFESQLKVRSAVERQADAKARQLTVWREERWPRVVRAVRELRHLATVKVRTQVHTAWPAVSTSSHPHADCFATNMMHPWVQQTETLELVDSIADSDVVSLPQLLMELEDSVDVKVDIASESTGPKVSGGKESHAEKKIKWTVEDGIEVGEAAPAGEQGEPSQSPAEPNKLFNYMTGNHINYTESTKAASEKKWEEQLADQLPKILQTKVLKRVAAKKQSFPAGPQDNAKDLGIWLREHYLHLAPDPPKSPDPPPESASISVASHAQPPLTQSSQADIDHAIGDFADLIAEDTDVTAATDGDAQVQTSIVDEVSATLTLAQHALCTEDGHDPSDSDLSDEEEDEDERAAQLLVEHGPEWAEDGEAGTVPMEEGEEAEGPYRYDRDHNVVVTVRTRATRQAPPLLRTRHSTVKSAWEAVVEACATLMGRAPNRALYTKFSAYQLELLGGAGAAQLLDIARCSPSEQGRQRAEELLSKAFTRLGKKKSERKHTYSRAALNAVIGVMCAAVPTAADLVSLEVGLVKRVELSAPKPWLELTPLAPVTAEGDAYRCAAGAAGGSVVRKEVAEIVGGLRAEAHPDYAGRRTGAWQIDQGELAQILAQAQSA